MSEKKYAPHSIWAARYETIKALRECGVPLERIGEYYGVTRQRVQQAMADVEKMQGQLAVPDEGVVIIEHPLRPWVKMETLRKMADQALDARRTPEQHLEKLLHRRKPKLVPLPRERK